MSTYVLSDAHGQYFAYKKMIELIDLKDDDCLYVLGDCIDRGPDGISIIKDIMKRDNVELILANHEFMLLNALEYFRNRGIDENINYMTSDDGLNAFELWTHPSNGGEETCLEYLNMPEQEQHDIEQFLRSSRLIKRIKIDGKTYHLSHSYSVPKQFGKEVFLEKTPYKTVESIVWESLFDKNKEYNPDEKLFGYQKDIYVVGHIFTQRLGNMDENGKGCIYKSDDVKGYKVIDVDCGMALNSRSSRLGCICLETEEEFYVSLLPD